MIILKKICKKEDFFNKKEKILTLKDDVVEIDTDIIFLKDMRLL